MKAAIVYSGVSPASAELSADNQDTLVQLQEISAILQSLDIETENFALNDSVGELEKNLLRIKPDFVFNLVETLKGTDSLIYLAAALFEFLRLPYSGCSALSLALLSSKVRQKKFLSLAGLPTPDIISEPHPQAAGGPWIVKSDTEHASVGLNSDSVVTTSRSAKLKIQQLTDTTGGRWFAERFIDGREFNISLLESDNGKPRILPPAEILFENFPDDMPKIVDYAAKWDANSYVYGATPRHFDFTAEDQHLLAKLEELCCKCWDLFALKGAARVDFRIDANGNPWIMEVNANPCLSSDAGFMVAAQKASLSAQKVIMRLLPGTLSR